MLTEPNRVPGVVVQVEWKLIRQLMGGVDDQRICWQRVPREADAHRSC